MKIIVDADNVGSMDINDLYRPADEAQNVFSPSSALPHPLPHNLMHYHPPCYNKYVVLSNISSYPDIVQYI